jgi:hypothetical protein
MAAALPTRLPPRSRWGSIALFAFLAIAATLLSGVVWTKLAHLIEE